MYPAQIYYEYETWLGGLTICMENPEILGRIQMGRFILVEIYFRYYLFTETTEMFCTICVDF